MKDLFPPLLHVVSVVGCEITSVDVAAQLKEDNATITFSAERVPENDDVKFHCKLDNNKEYKPCK